MLEIKLIITINQHLPAATHKLWQPIFCYGSKKLILSLVRVGEAAYFQRYTTSNPKTQLHISLLLHFHLPSQFRLQLIEVRQRLFLGSIDPVFRSGSRGGHCHFQHLQRFSSLSAQRRPVQKQQRQEMAW